MSFLHSCFCCFPAQESAQRTGDVTSSSIATPVENLLRLDDDLRFYDGVLRDCGGDGPKYADLIQSGNIPEVADIEISKCPVDYDFSYLFSRHRATIRSASILYVCNPNDDPNFPGAMLSLGSCLKDLHHLTFLRIHGDARSLFPAEFLEGLADIPSLTSLSLCGSFPLATLPLKRSSLEHLTIIEECCSEIGWPVDLSKLNRLLTVSISAKRRLILPEESSSIKALGVNNITLVESCNLPNLIVLRISDCTPSVVQQFLENSDPAILRELIIDSTDLIELHRTIDARHLDILYLSNIAFQYIDTSLENPVKSLCLNNSTTTTAISGLEFHAVSAYVSYTSTRHLNSLCLNQDILKRLGLGREDQKVREMTDLDNGAMQAVNRFKQNLEFLATFAPLTKFPEMPRLKYLALFSVAEWNLAAGKVTQLEELLIPGFFWKKSNGTSIDSLQSLAPSEEYYFDTFQYWSLHNEYAPYVFLY